MVKDGREASAAHAGPHLQSGLKSQITLQNNEHKRAKRLTALLFSSSKPKPSELQLRKGTLLRRTPRPCLAQAPLPLPISLASRISAAALFFKRPLAGPLVSRRRAKGLERRADNPPPSRPTAHGLGVLGQRPE